MPQFIDSTGTARKYIRPNMLVQDWLNLAQCAEQRAYEGVVMDGSQYSPRRETESRDALIKRCASRLAQRRETESRDALIKRCASRLAQWEGRQP